MAVVPNASLKVPEASNIFTALKTINFILQLSLYIENLSHNTEIIPVLDFSIDKHYRVFTRLDG